MQDVSISIEVSNCIETYFKFDDICMTLVCRKTFRSCRACFRLVLYPFWILVPRFQILAIVVCQGDWQCKCFCLWRRFAGGGVAIGHRVRCCLVVGVRWGFVWA